METNGSQRRFGDFEFDPQAARLFRGGNLVKIQPQPLRVLAVLLEHHGEMVSRQELRSRVWGDSTFVEFDKGLNYCIRQIRLALHDDASDPVYIETLPKQGYRFIAPVEVDFPGNTSPPETTSQVDQLPNAPPYDQPPASIQPAPTRRGAVVIGVTIVALTVAGGWWMMSGRSSSIPYPLHVTRVSKLTSFPGDEREPAISPDGSYVAFSWSGPQADNYDIYVVQMGGQQPLRLTRDPAPDSYPAWSPDGSQIAFVRRKGQMADIIVVPPLGGAERTLHQFFRIGSDLDFSQHPVLSWSQDGRSIIYSGQSRAGEKYRLFLLSLETGAVRAVSSPDADLAGDSSPAFSADGKSLAFVRYLAPRNGRLLIQALDSRMIPSGTPIEAKATGLALRSPVWFKDAEQLLFADATQIFHWERNRGAVPIYTSDGALGGLSIGPRRSDNSWQAVIASESEDPDIWSVPLNEGGTKATGPAQVLQRSTSWEGHPSFSPDGRSIVFASSRSGTPEIWVCDADGSNARQLTNLGAHVASYPNWSPDGRRIVFHARVPDIAQVYIVDANQGVPKQITHENPGLAVATWSKDGRFIYASTLVGGTAVTYRIPADGGPMHRLWEGALARESADGRYVIYNKTNTPGIFRRAVPGDLSKNAEELLVPDFWPNGQIGGYAPASNGIYYVSGNAQGRPGPFRFFDYTTRKSIDVAPAVPGLNRGFSVSPDRRRMVFPASAEVGGDLLSLELK